MHVRKVKFKVMCSYYDDITGMLSYANINTHSAEGVMNVEAA